MDLHRLLRIPQRVRQDIKIIGLASNWREILAAKSDRVPVRMIRLRNGVVLTAPDEVSLSFLFHEIWITEFYAPKGYGIRSGDMVVDIGGNIGVFSLYAATRADQVRVRSFEPFPENANYFVKNLTASGLDNVEFYPQAVAGSPGERRLHIEDSWILHSLTDDDQDRRSISVETTTLDKIFEDLEVCDLLKIDCEGSEYEILYAASPGTLSKIKRLVCEFNLVDEKQKNGQALKEFLTLNGFIVDQMEVLDSNSGIICARKG
jgi:FkbM family methyltransferase